jgi:UDP-2,3-diacylglucosamine pyrophosphatase LpxH
MLTATLKRSALPSHQEAPSAGQIQGAPVQHCAKTASAVLGSRRRTVFLSDLHLGSKHCHAEELADFLAQLQCERLYLVGDILDLWWIASRRVHWGVDENRVIELLHDLSRRGTQLVYIPGNHDRPIRRMCGLVLPTMRVRRRAIHRTVDGRRLLVTHGDEFDSVTQFGNLQERFGDWLYERILTGNRWLNRTRQRCGLRYWSLAEFLKRRSGAAERYIARYAQAGLDDARRRRLDGIVCGHIHRAALIQHEGVIYANDGDWVESLTAFVEELDGTLRLLTHRGEVLAELPPLQGRPLEVPVALLQPRAA